MQRLLRIALLVVGISCTVIFCSVNYERTITDGREISDLRIGFEPDPWYRLEVTPEKTSSAAYFVTWSGAFMVLAIICFTAYARLPRPQTPQPDGATGA